MDSQKQLRLFDGFVVDIQKGSIGIFDIEEPDTSAYRADEVLVLVVTASVTGASFKANNSGDWVRTNKLTAHQVKVADGVMKDEIVEFFNLAGDELPFPKSTPAPVSDSQESDSDDEEDEEDVSTVVENEIEADVHADSPLNESQVLVAPGQDLLAPPPPTEGIDSRWDEALAREAHPASQAHRDPALASFLGGDT